MHQSVLKFNGIVANNIATRSTIFRIIKQLKEIGDTRAKKNPLDNQDCQILAKIVS